MANSILDSLGSQPNPDMIQQIKQFAKSIKGNPRDQVMSMVQQGMRSNEQLQQAMNMARQLQGMFK